MSILHYWRMYVAYVSCYRKQPKHYMSDIDDSHITNNFTNFKFRKTK